MADSVSVGSDIPENISIDTLNTELEELDDNEYDIPPVEHAPTLESILNDVDDRGSISEDEVSGNHLIHPGEAFETWSMGSIGGRSRSSSERHSTTRSSSSRAPSNAIPVKAGSILRHVILKAISSQVVSASDRSDAGLPTCIAVQIMVAVGTSHGLVLVFDSSQTLRWCLDSQDKDQGSVSALCFNYEVTRLLVGYARGHILMYDVKTGKLLRTMTDVHAPGTAVLHVKFTDNPNLALCSDSGGSVFELTFKRTMGVRGCSSKCLFSGSRGEVCTIEPLLLDSVPGHPLHGTVLVAMATLSKIIVVSIRPRMKVLFTFPLKAHPATLPLVSWQFVIIQVGEQSRVVDPVLAFARESTVHFYQVTLDMASKIRLIPLQKLCVPYLLLSLHWLNPRTLATVDTLEQVHLIDVRSQIELEVVDISNAGLVYGSSHFKGLSTGGNVSKALALAGERACYNSLLSFGNQMVILGTRGLHVLGVRTWKERLDHLIRQKNYLDALALALAFYQDRAKAVVGLKGPKCKRRALTRDKAIDILYKYIEYGIGQAPSATEHLYREAVPACVLYSIELNEQDILFNQLWEVVSLYPVSKAIYLEALEPYLLNEQLTEIPPQIVQDFVQHYCNNKKLLALEACVVHIPVTSLDFHQVMSICWEHGLYDAIIHLYTKGMQDYVNPLQELLHVLQNAIATGRQLSNQQITLGNKLLVYISCCLAGRGYPYGDVPPDLVQTVKQRVFQCVTCQHSLNAKDTEPVYPYLRVLLQFDTKEFLNVLALAFEEPEFTSELGLRRKQLVVDILLQLVVKEQGFSASQVGALLTFLARQLAQNGPSDRLHVDISLFERVVDHLTEPGAVGSQKEEREQALLELMQAGGLSQFDPEDLLRKSEEAKFYRVEELLLLERGDVHLVVDCYLQDHPRRMQVFQFLFSELSTSPEIDKSMHTLLLNTVEKKLKDLVAIDATQTGQLIHQYLHPKLYEIIDKLNNDPSAQYAILQGLFLYYNQNLSREEPSPEPVLAEKYIELLCQHCPENLCDFLQTNQWYRLDEALNTSKRFNQDEATALLLERSGDFLGAFSMLLNRLEPYIAKLDAENTVSIQKINTITVELVRLSKKGSVALDVSTRQDNLWFPLLRSLLKAHIDHKTEIRPLLQQVLNSMSPYVNLPEVIQIILQDPAYRGGTFGEIRDLMMGMLGNCWYEELLLQSTFRLLSADLHMQLAKELAVNNKGFGPRASAAVRNSPICSYCRDSLATVGASEDEKAILFRCGHSYHMRCIEEPPQCLKCVT
ncbi:vacuolar protein sorting-associated protein 8 homolog [Frankliniella occidentalis]|uniref:Vacuolar protein sorting-associated protein 8 homolog n=1 Tax=Frankliniella occidentalis TaxID=133901 RepID=A0A9C6X3M9_FRAOC|nr:vacuolar protein sorting-associated protein 8 homolog [Frankliniella occidentalis]